MIDLSPSLTGPSGTNGSFFDDAIAALIKPARQFGSITAQITISERHSDRAEKTSHPIETNYPGTGNISDHIIIQPSQVILRMGWTNYGLQSVSTYVNEAINGASIPTPVSIKKAYDQVRAMFTSRIPFKLITGKRSFPNMVILGIQEDTDERTENSLILTVLCEEIFLVQTQVVAAPPNSLHADPASSGSPTDNGTKQLLPAPTSLPPPP